MCTAGTKYRCLDNPKVCTTCQNLIWNLKCQHKTDLEIIQEAKRDLQKLKETNQKLLNAVTDFITENYEEYYKLKELNERFSQILTKG